MASQPLLPQVTARVDGQGRLVAADPPLLALQEEAGGRLGLALAVPQLAAIARLATRLGVPIVRPAVAASETEDIDLLVRAEPDPDGVTLTVERSSVRPPARPRWVGKPGPQEAADESLDLLIDPELRISRLSPGLARRLGVVERDVVGTSLSRLLRPVEDDSGNLPLLAALAGHRPFTGQPAIVRGTEERLLLDGSPLAEGDRFEGYRILLRGADQLSPLAALPLDNLLKEPLASIIEQAQEIAARSEGPLRNDYAGYGADIAAAARHLLELLAAISPGDRGGAQAEIEGEPVDLAELVLEAAGLVQPQAATKSVVLDIGGVGRLAARGQPRSICQILVNLIGNAVRHSPQGGEIAITLADGGEASVTVSDQGPGVAPEDRARIFERFEQAGQIDGGSGLGLTISRRLAREMGGDVELLPSPAGATFRLRLPAVTSL